VCTVTAIPGTWLQPGLGAAASWSNLKLPLLRIVCNRDERRSRARALAPSVVQTGDRFALMPIDPEGGGTWVAVNDAGLLFALLNVTTSMGGDGSPAPKSATARRSRGAIIRLIAGAATVEDTRLAVESLHPADYLPFHLMVWSEREVLEIVSEGEGYRIGHGFLHAPMLRTSSRLGDARVRGVRQALFERLLCQTLTPAAQDAFHRHSWPDRREVSVFMSRPDARTVSITTIELHRDRIEMIYEDVDASLSNCRTLRTAAPTTPVAPLASDALGAAMGWDCSSAP
jgi:hypothetical protein